MESRSGCSCPRGSERRALFVALAMALGPWVIGSGQAHAERPTAALWAEVERAVTAAPGDLDAILRSVGKDPKALLAWVKTTIRFEPYEGVLRGPAGTAAARGGNALDQALLLQALLAKADVVATLHTRKLSRDEGEALLTPFLMSRGVRLIEDVPRRGANATNGLKVDEGEVAGLSAAQEKADAEAVEEAVAASLEVTPKLIKALGKFPPPRKLLAPSHHVWVEVAGDALDPIAPTLDRAGAKVLDTRALERQRHTLTVSLVMKRTRAGKAETETLLQVPMALDSVAGRAIDLTIRPELDLLAKTRGAKRPSDKELRDALAGAGVLRASLLVGDKRHGAAAFDRKGVRYEVDDDGGTRGPAALGASLGGALGGFSGLGGGGTPKAEGPVVFESVVLRIEIRGPAESTNPERVHERVLVSADPEELPLVRVALLIDNLPLPPGARERSTLRALLQARPAYEALLRGDTDVAKRLADPREPVGALLRFVDLRRAVQARLTDRGAASMQHLRERAGLVAMIDRVAHSGGKLVVQRRLDIMANPIAFVDSTGALDVTGALAQGVADTALEAAVLGPASDAARKATAWSRLGAAQALSARKDKGLIRVAATETADAWWSIDPRSGNAVGRVRGGGGQAMVEYAYEVSSKVCDWSWALSFASSSQPQHQGLGDADKWMSRFCALVTGTEMQQYAKEQISEVSNTLWKIAIPALRGLPAKD